MNHFILSVNLRVKICWRLLTKTSRRLPICSLLRCDNSSSSNRSNRSILPLLIRKLVSILGQLAIISPPVSFSNKDNPNNHLLTDWPTGHFMVVRVLTLKKKLLLINVDSMSTLIRWLPLRINVAVVRAQFKRDCLISRQQSSVFIGSSGVAGISIDPS